MRIGRSEVCATTNSAEKKRISGSGFPCRPLQTVIHYVFGLFFMYIHFFFRHGSVLHRAHRALMHRSTHNMTLGPTLYNVILSIARNFLETRENIKISTLPYKFGQILKGIKQKKEKKIKMAASKKLRFSKSPILKIFSQKNSQTGPWVCKID